MPHSALSLPRMLMVATGCLTLSIACTRPDSPPPPVATAPTTAPATPAAEATAPATPAAEAPAPTTPAVPATPTSCAHPFGLHDGSELSYRLSDAAGRQQGLQVLKVAHINQYDAHKKSPAYTEVLLKSVLYDANNRLLRNDEYTYQCRRDSILTDGRLLLDPDMLKPFRDRLFDYQPVALSWPNQPTAGELPGGRMTVRVHSPSVDIADVTTTVSQRRLDGSPQPITVPAGTFQCYKVTSRYEYSTEPKGHDDMVRRSVKQVVDYYSPAVGLVRSEISNDNGKLQQVSELTKRSGAKH